jgi:hypothetical protein
MQGVLAPKHFRIFLLPIGSLETRIKYTKLCFFWSVKFYLLMCLESINQGYTRTWCRGEHLNPNGSNRRLQKIAWRRDSWFTLLSKYSYVIELWRMRWAGRQGMPHEWEIREVLTDFQYENRNEEITSSTWARENNIKMDLKEIGGCIVDSSGHGHGQVERFCDTIINAGFP